MKQRSKVAVAAGGRSEEKLQQQLHPLSLSPLLAPRLCRLSVVEVSIKSILLPTSVVPRAAMIAASVSCAMDLATFEQLCLSGRNQDLLVFRDGPDCLRAMEFLELASSPVTQFMALAILQHGLMARVAAVPDALERLFRVISRPDDLRSPLTSAVFAKLLQVRGQPLQLKCF